MLATVRGFVLRRNRIADADVSFEVLTETGETVRLRAHGILASKRRTGLVTEPAALIEAVYYAHDAGGSLKEGRVLDRFEECKGDYRSMLVASHLLELCSRSARGVEGGQLFTLLQGALQEFRRLDSRAGDFVPEARCLLAFVKVRLAGLLGVLAAANQCSECGAELGPLAVWLLPELAFRCPRCSDQATALDGELAALTRAAGRARFSVFRAGLSQSHATVALWDTRLLSCLEHFFGSALTSSAELYRELGSSG